MKAFISPQRRRGAEAGENQDGLSSASQHLCGSKSSLRLPRIEELAGNGQLIAIARVDGELATFFKAALDMAEEADFRMARVAAEGAVQRLRELELDCGCDEEGVFKRG